MFTQSQLSQELASQRVAELHDAASRARLAGHPAYLQRTRAYAGGALIALGMRLAPAGTPATNRVTKLAGR